MLKAIQDLRGFSEKKIVGVTELMRAAATGDAVAVRKAIESPEGGLPIKADDVDYEGRTALHVAAKGSHSARTPTAFVHSSHCGVCTVCATGRRE